MPRAALAVAAGAFAALEPRLLLEASAEVLDDAGEPPDGDTDAGHDGCKEHVEPSAATTRSLALVGLISAERTKPHPGGAAFLGSRLSASGRDGSPLGGRPDSPAGSSPHSYSLD
jgi:hypothetical protein